MRKTPNSAQLARLAGLALVTTSMVWVLTTARGDTPIPCENREPDTVWCPSAGALKTCSQKYLIPADPKAVPPIPGNKDKIAGICNKYVAHEKLTGPFSCKSYDKSWCTEAGYCYECYADTSSWYVCSADFKCYWDPDAPHPSLPDVKGACLTGDAVLNEDDEPVTTAERGYYAEFCWWLWYF